MIGDAVLENRKRLGLDRDRLYTNLGRRYNSIKDNDNDSQEFQPINRSKSFIQWLFCC